MLMTAEGCSSRFWGARVRDTGVGWAACFPVASSGQCSLVLLGFWPPPPAARLSPAFSVSVCSPRSPSHEDTWDGIEGPHGQSRILSSSSHLQRPSSPNKGSFIISSTSSSLCLASVCFFCNFYGLVWNHLYGTSNS